MIGVQIRETPDLPGSIVPGLAEVSTYVQIPNGDALTQR
jgi:hypothetical protein